MLCSNIYVSSSRMVEMTLTFVPKGNLITPEAQLVSHWVRNNETV